MREFDDLCNELKHYLSPTHIAEIERAFLLAHEAHIEQTRSSGDPYITHPIAVAKILAQMRMDYQTIIAAILHDVIEDTDINKDTLVHSFGDEIADLVDGVSKLTQIHFETKAEAQAANFRKMMMAMAKDIRVIVIKLADRLHNMQTLSHVSPEKRHRIAKETLEIYAPIANRLGMRAFRDTFYDLGFSCLYPMRYAVLKEAVQSARGNRREIVKKIEQGLEQGLRQAGIEDFRIWGREKNLFSIYKKMHKKHLRLSEVMDVYGFRILVNSVDQCYRVLGAVHGLYKPVPERFKDYIAIPKSNGYQSLHTTLFGPYGLPVEIQIRTFEMDKMAENGIAAHWLYKSDHKEEIVNQAHLRAREWIKGVLEIQKSTGNSLEFIENVKIDLFPDEVYVFTPKGDILELPHGATAVDFAYAVHSDVGNSCIAVKLDRRLVPLSSTLRSGQTVEVVTAPGARPNPAWLNFVVTAKARSGIRHFLKRQQRTESVNLGKRLLEQACKNLHIYLDAIEAEQWDAYLRETAFHSKQDVFEALGLGNELAPIVAQRLTGSSITDSPYIHEQEKEVLVIKGTEGMAVSFAKCCYPIPGDIIMGMLTAGRGIVVHTEHCANLLETKKRHPEKCISIRWEEEVHGEFEAALTVEMENQRGSLARLALAVANAESSIEDISVVLQDGHYARVNLLLTITGRVHLARVIRRMRQLTQVHRIFRQRTLPVKKKKGLL